MTRFRLSGWLPHAGAPDGRLSANVTFESARMAYPYGIHLAQVRVDPETCGVTVERFLVAFDVGWVVNPMLVRGQIAGGAAQAWAVRCSRSSCAMPMASRNRSASPTT